jgi:iron-sulfur cluster assembly accessory protein
MSIEITESAISATDQLQSEVAEYREKDLRIYLAGKHCDGFEYGVTFDTRESADTVIPVKTSFNLICDTQTLEFVRGSTIDWVDDERGRGYLVLNPNHKKFRGKFYKKSEWKSKLTQ